MKHKLYKQDAATTIAANQIRRLLIVEKDKVVGIVSLGDIAVNDPSEADAEIALEYISEPVKLNKE